MIYPRFIVAQLFMIQSMLSDGVMAVALMVVGALFMLAAFVRRVD